MTVHGAFHGRWAQSFLENCRTYLPPTHRLNDMSLQTTLEFVVDDAGSVVSTSIITSSDNEEFDQAAIEVVTESHPLSAPPLDLRSDDGLVHVRWRFARDVRQDGVAGAAIERVQWEPARAVPALLANGRVSEAAERLVKAISTESPPQSSTASTLVALGRDVAGALLAAILKDESDPAARVEAAHAVATGTWAPLLPLLRTLAVEATDLALQRAALEGLGTLKDKDALPLLTEMVGKLDGDRSAAAAGAMARMGEKKAAWKLIEPHVKNKDARVRGAALATLGGVGEPDSVPVLAALLANKTSPRAERAAAAEALGPSAIEAVGPATKALSSALTDGDAHVRAAAAGALARGGKEGLRSKALFYKLSPLLKDKDPRVRAAAALAVAAVESTLATPELLALSRKERDRGVLGAMAAALAGVPGQGALDVLTKFAASSDVGVRMSSIRALASRSEPAAQAVLVPLFADADPEVRAVALTAIVDPTAIASALTDASPLVRAAAVRALVRLRTPIGALSNWGSLIASAASAGERLELAEAWLVSTSDLH